MRIRGVRAKVIGVVEHDELILVVDDEPKVVKQARDYLERSRFRVVPAGDGKTALAQARHERPDLVVWKPLV